LVGRQATIKITLFSFCHPGSFHISISEVLIFIVLAALILCYDWDLYKGKVALWETMLGRMKLFPSRLPDFAFICCCFSVYPPHLLFFFLVSLICQVISGIRTFTQSVPSARHFLSPTLWTTSTHLLELNVMQPLSKKTSNE
jgi:hypothetical protein